MYICIIHDPEQRDTGNARVKVMLMRDGMMFMRLKKNIISVSDSDTEIIFYSLKQERILFKKRKFG